MNTQERLRLLEALQGLAHREDENNQAPPERTFLPLPAHRLALRPEIVIVRGAVFATYDHLDRIGAFDANVRRRYVGALLALWLSYSNRYRHLRAKIFLRDDLLDAGELGFPDASKLRSRSVSIDWDVASLYRAAVRHMAEGSDPLRDWLRRVKYGFELEDRGEFGWMPGPMSEDTQWSFATLFAGEVMGAGANKGYTCRWIPNHLQDAQKRIVPRSMLCLFGFAASEAAKHPLTKGPRLVTPQDLFAALEETSRARVGEISEEYKLVLRLHNLRGLSVMLDPDVVMKKVGLPVADEPPGLVTDGKAVLDELVRLGVLSVRSDGRIDVPDIYRSGFGILRKGGTARAQ